MYLEHRCLVTPLVAATSIYFASTEGESRLKKLTEGTIDYLGLQTNIKVLDACESMRITVIENLSMAELRKYATTIQDAGVTFPLVHRQHITSANTKHAFDMGKIDVWAGSCWPFAEFEDGDATDDWSVGCVQFRLCPPTEDGKVAFKDRCLA